MMYLGRCSSGINMSHRVRNNTPNFQQSNAHQNFNRKWKDLQPGNDERLKRFGEVWTICEVGGLEML